MRQILRHPKTTIIVPCYNEENTVKKTIYSLLALTYPKERLEIIMVDDGSVDNTWQVLQQFKNNSQVTLLSKKNGGKYTALNLGLEHASGELVGCLDADSFVDRNALLEIIPYFNSPSVMAVTPAIKVYEPRTLIQYIQKAEYSLSIFIRRVFAELNTLFITPGPFSIFRKEFFDTFGGYRHAYNTEDLEIALRIQSNHYTIKNAHTASVYTVVPDTFRKLFAQRLRWTYGFLKNIFDYRFLFFSKQHGNLGFVVLPFATVSLFGALYFMGILGVSLVERVAAKILEVQIAGAHSLVKYIDWFYIETHSLVFLVYTLLLVTLVLIIIGKKLAREKRLWSFDVLFYLFLYGFIAPLWLAGAVYNVALSRKTYWK